tara:strand:- start:693 stop:1415 length:723 start_codon:yes stop_codon:yes gene_type:complete
MVGQSTFGSGDNPNRISLRGGRFHQSIDGEHVSVSDGPLDLIIVNAAKLARTYYEGAYDPANPSAPTCWSPDTQIPSKDVPTGQKQANRCMDCRQNIKGSSIGGGRACRYSQRLAVVLEGHMDTVYQMRIPATSIFGKDQKGDMSMQGYAKYLHKHKTSSISVVTRVRFDEKSETPKLFFKAVRALNEQELNKAIEQKSSRAASTATLQTMSVQLETARDSSPFTEVSGFEYNKGEDLWQ